MFKSLAQISKVNKINTFLARNPVIHAASVIGCAVTTKNKANCPEDADRFLSCIDSVQHCDRASIEI